MRDIAVGAQVWHTGGKYLGVVVAKRKVTVLIEGPDGPCLAAPGEIGRLVMDAR